MSTYRSRAADQRSADEFVSGQELMCGAQGCPHRWSVDNGAGRLCSWHAWAPSHRWPQITQERLEAMTAAAMRAQRQEQAPPPPSMSKDEKIVTLRALRDIVAAPKTSGRTGWARKIIAKAKEGLRVSPLVLRMAQDVAGRIKAMREKA